ncbi:MAG: response regulator [Bacteriovoracaceae bacterium]|jgi:DNA-binding NarL/FixJ family response regulator|nr:response regulator [Bacteriovoracaceae bacterium]
MTNQNAEEMAGKFFENKRVLIIDPSSTTRVSIRKFAESLGVKKQDISQADNFSVAKDLLQSEKPEVVFTDYRIQKVSSINFLEEHIKIFPNRIDTCFVVLSGQNSPSVTCQLAESEIDTFISKPFTLDLLKNKFISNLSHKFNPSEYHQLMDNARASYRAGEMEKAIETATFATEKSELPSGAYSLIGQIKLGQGKKDEAHESFEKGLEFQPDNYQCLKNTLILEFERKNYKLAYEMALMFVLNYSTPPSMLPFLMKAALANEKFVDIINFHKIFMDLDPDEDQVALRPAIAAGLTLTGQFYLKNDQEDQGLDALKKATILGDQRKNILKKITMVYVESGHTDEANKLFNLLEELPDLKPGELKDLELEIKCDHYPAGEVLQLASNALKNGAGTPRIHEIVIRKSIEVDRNADAINNAIENAIISFPEQKDFFRSLYK